MTVITYDSDADKWAAVELSTYNKKELKQLLKSAEWHNGRPEGLEESA